MTSITPTVNGQNCIPQIINGQQNEVCDPVTPPAVHSLADLSIGSALGATSLASAGYATFLHFKSPWDGDLALDGLLRGAGHGLLACAAIGTGLASAALITRSQGVGPFAQKSA